MPPHAPLNEPQPGRAIFEGKLQVYVHLLFHNCRLCAAVRCIKQLHTLQHGCILVQFVYGVIGFRCAGELIILISEHTASLYSIIEPAPTPHVLTLCRCCCLSECSRTPSSLSCQSPAQRWPSWCCPATVKILCHPPK